MKVYVVFKPSEYEPGHDVLAAIFDTEVKAAEFVQSLRPLDAFYTEEKVE